MSEVTFLRAFETLSLSPSQFHHRDHVRLAWLYLRDHPMPVALEKFAMGLRRFATHYGASGKYHETITWALLTLIHERMEPNSGMDWEAFEATNADLFEWPSPLLARYYTPEILASDLARSSFVMPDRVI
jgi:hypothetical protein